jgi:hypothetical protein
LRGFKAGRRIVTPGVYARLMMLIGTVVPERALAPLLATLQRPRPKAPAE